MDTIVVWETALEVAHAGVCRSDRDGRNRIVYE